MAGQQKIHLPYISRSIHIGHLALGGLNPIRIQSMTSTNTLNTAATVSQSIQMIKAGCELVRITCPGLKEAENLKVIKNKLRQAGYTVPIIADIHFNAKVAEHAAKFVEKVRINPGNYTGSQSRLKTDLSEDEYRFEIEKTAEKLYPLLKICKECGTVIRVGVNHGSLSERIINKFGNTPKGMVASAMEFIQICQAYQFDDLVLSMKSSNLKIMVQAYRLLVSEMQQKNMSYPLHLGVTEAGNGLDGRIKSTAGIGTLLREGIGDTIRVSLTEAPEKEIIFAKSLVQILGRHTQMALHTNEPFRNIDPFEYHRRTSQQVDQIGGGRPPVVISTNPNEEADYIYNKANHSFDGEQKSFKIKTAEDRGQFIEFKFPIGKEKFKEKLQHICAGEILLFVLTSDQSVFEIKNWISYLSDQKIDNPIVIKKTYRDNNYDDLIIRSSTDFGSLLIDGLIDGIWIENDHFRDQTTHLTFRILQASGSRISSTEFIACPSCGRTKFNIEQAFEEVKREMSHLVGLKIAVMGCIVNGPGEMADADYGYIGAGNGKVNLYKSRELVKKGVDEKLAVAELIALIKANDNWKEKH